MTDESHQSLLNKLYKDPTFGLASKDKFVKKVRALHKEIPVKTIKEFISNQSLQQQTSAKPFKGYFKIVAKPNSFQIDIFFMERYKKYNKNISAFFIAVDILSRKMYVKPIKDKTTSSIISACKSFLDTHKVNRLFGDNEFKNKEVVSFLQSKGVDVVTGVSKNDHISKGNRLGIVDSATRTIKKYLRNYMVENNKAKFIDVLDSLVENYNNTPHSSLDNKTPNDVYDDIDAQQNIYEDAMEHNIKLERNIDLEIGDYVRKVVGKSSFEKEKTTFSKEIYVIFDKKGYKYKLITQDGEDVKGLYKYFELLKVDASKVEVKRLSEVLDAYYSWGNRPTRGDVLSKIDTERKVERKLKKEGISEKNVIVERMKTRSSKSVKWGNRPTRGEPSGK